jgi:starch synthase (maltosyl-transferring)
VQFFAETLGAPLGAVLALRDAGFDYIFNSSKWWNFNEWWALEQHARFCHVAPSVAFPESHDTARLAAESGGSEAVQRQRYAFAAAFSAGVMMTTGYEFGFQRQVSVLDTLPSDWERRRMNLGPFVRRVNGLKVRHAVLHGEGELSAPFGLGGSVLVLQRCAGGEEGWVLVNKRPDVGQEITLTVPERYRLFRVCRDDAAQDGEPVPQHIPLGPAEVAYVLPAL